MQKPKHGASKRRYRALMGIVTAIALLAIPSASPAPIDTSSSPALSQSDEKEVIVPDTSPPGQAAQNWILNVNNSGADLTAFKLYSSMTASIYPNWRDGEYMICANIATPTNANYDHVIGASISGNDHAGGNALI